MSDKVRIHDLAKRYGMPGKDLAARLRDCGFSQAKSHMSSLDPFELMQAEGILAANGITPSVTEEELEGGGSVGGLKIKRKTKKKKSDAVEADEPTPPAPTDEPEGVQDKVSPADEAEEAPEIRPDEDEAAPSTPGEFEDDPPTGGPSPAPAEQEGDAAEAAAEEQESDDVQEPEEEGGESGAGPRGKVVGFIDPTKFQASERA
ncbi:MAG: translation initiation factor IF-2 N-terminal domain-containing protein, partial [Planctomycetota bacterium]|nr:translation initiation factor IF-2 N-terminal domain-containing protein [Planctomycetota bacterium]